MQEEEVKPHTCYLGLGGINSHCMSNYLKIIEKWSVKIYYS